MYKNDYRFEILFIRFLNIFLIFYFFILIICHFHLSFVICYFKLLLLLYFFFIFLLQKIFAFFAKERKGFAEKKRIIFFLCVNTKHKKKITFDFIAFEINGQ